MVAVPFAVLRTRLFAPSDSPLVICGAVHEVKDSATEKSAAAPEELETIANLDPVVSLTTVAVTPRPALVVGST
jgi:hypothetical protein